MFKNTAGQKFTVFAFDSTTNQPKTGDAANITAYVAKDNGTVTVLGDTSATEMDATNAKGYYLFDAAQAETNGDVLLVSAKSSTANIVVVGVPAAIFTFPTTGILAPSVLGRTLVVDASGLADSNMVKIGPTGSGTAQTARDVGASVLLSAGTGTGQLDFASGVVKANLVQILATALTEAAGQLAAGFKKFFNIASPAATMDHGVLVDTVTNAPSAGDFTAAMKTSLNAATPAATVSDKTGFSLTAAYDAAKTAAAQTTADGIKTQTDKLAFTVANQVDSNPLALTGGAAEVVAVPAAAASPISKLGYMFSKMVNKRLTTSTTDKVRNSADSADVSSATIADDGTTFSKTRDA